MLWHLICSNEPTGIVNYTCQRQRFGTYRGKNLKSFRSHFSIHRKKEPLKRRSQGKIFVQPNWPSLEPSWALESPEVKLCQIWFWHVPKYPSGWKCPLYQVNAVLNILKLFIIVVWCNFSINFPNHGPNSQGDVVTHEDKTKFRLNFWSMQGRTLWALRHHDKLCLYITILHFWIFSVFNSTPMWARLR